MRHVLSYGLFESETVAMYHVADVLSRNSIEKNGIDHTLGFSPWDGAEIDFPKGNYMWSDLKKAVWYANGLSEPMDIWEVQVDSSSLVTDPVTAGGSYTTDPVKPDKIKLIKTVNT